MCRWNSCPTTKNKKKPSPRQGKESQNYEKNVLLCCGNNGDKTTILTAFVELDHAVDKSEQRMILTHSNILTGIVNGAALTDDNVTGDALLATEDFHA